MFKPILTSMCLFFALISSAAYAEREWPENKFECQVVTSSGARGLVSLQTFTRQDAMKRVVGMNAVSDRDTVETASSVVQCIDLGKDETFYDAAFQNWRDNLEE